MHLLPLLITPTYGVPLGPGSGSGSGYVPLLFLLFGNSNNPSSVTVPFEADLVTYLNLVPIGIPFYPGHVPQLASLPAITYQCLFEEPSYTIARAAGLTSRNYQFSAFSHSYLQVCSIERSLRALLHGYRGSMGTTSRVTSRLVQCLDLYEPNVDGSDSGTFQRVTEYRITFTEPIPILY